MHTCPKQGAVYIFTVSEYEHLANILIDSAALKIPSDGKCKTIREYEVEKYEYREHKYKD